VALGGQVVERERERRLFPEATLPDGGSMVDAARADVGQFRQ
jgi:hypothetical protein